MYDLPRKDNAVHGGVLKKKSEQTCARVHVTEKHQMKRIKSDLLNILGLAGGAHRPLTNTLELFSAFTALVIFSLYPVGGDIDINRASNGTHVCTHLYSSFGLPSYKGYPTLSVIF